MCGRGIGPGSGVLRHIYKILSGSVLESMLITIQTSMYFENVKKSFYGFHFLKNVNFELIIDSLEVRT